MLGLKNVPKIMKIRQIYMQKLKFKFNIVVSAMNDIHKLYIRLFALHISHCLLV